MNKNEKMEAKRFAKRVAEEKGSLKKVVMSKMVLLESGTKNGEPDYVMFEYEGKQYQVYATEYGYTFNEYVETPEFPSLTDLEVQTLFDITQDDFYENGVESVLWADVFLDTTTLSISVVRGVLSSLIKKDMINPIAKGRDGSIALTEIGQAYIRKTYNTEYPTKEQDPRVWEKQKFEEVKEEKKMKKEASKVTKTTKVGTPLEAFMVVNKKNNNPVVNTEGNVKTFTTEAEAEKLVAKMTEAHPTATYLIVACPKDNEEAPKAPEVEAPKKASKETTTEGNKTGLETKIEPQTNTKKPNTSNSPSRKAKKAEMKKLEAKKGEVLLKAFTGMIIGVFPITKQTKKTITITTNAGELKFNTSDLKQENAKNPKFANRIELGK